MRHILSVQVENHPGVLTRVASLFARRGYNIESLAVGETESPDISRMTIVVSGNDTIIEQVTKQLHKLIEVLKITDLTSEKYVDRELILVKVSVDPQTRGEIMQIADIFRARIVDVGTRTLVVETTGDEGKIDALVQSLRPYGIVEMTRTGKIALARGPKSE